MKAMPPKSDYQAELAEWDCTYPDDRNTFQVRDATKNVIATVTISDRFTVEDARRIATFIETAPDLWRMLRELARWLSYDENTLDQYSEALKLLWASAGRNPYALPEDCKDEGIIAHNMRRAGFAVAEKEEVA